MDFISGDAMDYVSGLDCLGAEETTTDKTLNVIKKVGPGLVSAVSEAFDKKAPAPEAPKYQAETKSWFTTPSVLGLPGYAVVLLGGGLVTGLGFAVKAMLKR